jgi:outer membrane immunogenic protein
MRKLLFATTALTALAALAAPAAFAADLGVRRAPAPAYVEPAFNWTGFYIGANVGYGWGRGDVTVFGFTGSQDMNGVLGGGQFGYNWQFVEWILGLEADGQATDQHRDSVGTIGAVTITERDEIPWFVTLRGRVGYAVAPMWMIYATGGAAWTDFKATVTATGLGSASWETSHVGWTAGAGVEAAINRNWSWKVEYLHIDTDNFNTTIFGVPATARFQNDIARVGINYRFY